MQGCQWPLKLLHDSGVCRVRSNCAWQYRPFCGNSCLCIHEMHVMVLAEGCGSCQAWQACCWLQDAPYVALRTLLPKLIRPVDLKLLLVSLML